MIQDLMFGCGSVEDTVELWGSTLRDVKGFAAPPFGASLKPEAGPERFDQDPFGIGEVACAAQSGPAISSQSNFSSGQPVSVRLRTRGRSQPIEIVHLYFSVRL